MTYEATRINPLLIAEADTGIFCSISTSQSHQIQIHSHPYHDQRVFDR